MTRFTISFFPILVFAVFTSGAPLRSTPYSDILLAKIDALRAQGVPKVCPKQQFYLQTVFKKVASSLRSSHESRFPKQYTSPFAI